MKILGILLVIVGCVSLAYGGIQYRQHHTVLQVGDLKATTTEHKMLPIPPIAGVACLVVGVGLVVVDMRGSRRL